MFPWWRTGIAVTFHSDLEFVALPSGMEDDLYRIVQEALHNVVKHAQASAVLVRIAARGSGKGLLVVDISDDGVGFHRQQEWRVRLDDDRHRIGRHGDALSGRGDDVRDVRSRLDLTVRHRHHEVRRPYHDQRRD